MDLSIEGVAGVMDHALLSPTLTDRDLETGCRWALQAGCASVCILPHYLPRCAQVLAGSPARPGTTIGFPHGGRATATHLAEARRALDDGGRVLEVCALGATRVGSSRTPEILEECRRRLG